MNAVDVPPPQSREHLGELGEHIVCVIGGIEVLASHQHQPTVAPFVIDKGAKQHAIPNLIDHHASVHLAHHAAGAGVIKQQHRLLRGDVTRASRRLRHLQPAVRGDGGLAALMQFGVRQDFGDAHAVSIGVADAQAHQNFGAHHIASLVAGVVIRQLVQRPEGARRECGNDEIAQGDVGAVEGGVGVHA